MKKLLVLMMSLMMGFSLVACGGDDADTAGDANASAGDEVVVDTQVVEDEVVEDDAVETEVYYLSVGDFTQLASLEMPDLSGTTWSLASGTLEGVELTQDELVSTLEMYGGKNDIVFGEDGVSAQMVQGSGAVAGSCEYMDNGIAVVLNFDFGGDVREYKCLLTEVEGVSVLMAMPDPTSAFYYLL